MKKALSWLLMASFVLTLLVPLTGIIVHKLASAVFLLLCLVHVLIYRKKNGLQTVGDAGRHPAGLRQRAAQPDLCGNPAGAWRCTRRSPSPACFSWPFISLCLPGGAAGRREPDHDDGQTSAFHRAGKPQIYRRQRGAAVAGAGGQHRAGDGGLPSAGPAVGGNGGARRPGGHGGAGCAGPGRAVRLRRWSGPDELPFQPDGESPAAGDDLRKAAAAGQRLPGIGAHQRGGPGGRGGGGLRLRRGPAHPAECDDGVPPGQLHGPGGRIGLR